MYAQVEKTKENTSSAVRRESRAVANAVGQNKGAGKQHYGFADNRAKALIQTKVQPFINNRYSSQLIRKRGKHVPGEKALQLNSEKVTPAPSRIYSGSKSGVIQLIGQVGEQPVGFREQLSSRIRQMWTEADLQDNDTLENRLMAKIVQMGGATAPTTFNQIGKIVQAAIHASFGASANGMDIFYGTILNNIAMIWNTNQTAFALDSCVNYFQKKVNNRANALIHEQIDNSNNKDLMEAANGLRFDHLETGGAKFSKLAENFNQLSDVDVSTPFTVSASEKRVLSKALKSMPVVQDILSGESGLITQRKVEDLSSENPNFIKWLAPEIVAAGDSELNSKIVSSVNQAMAIVVNMVSPGVLAGLPVPRVVVHRNTGLLDVLKSGRLSDLAGYRASSSRDRMEIDIADNEMVPVIMHEIGHQLEYFLGTSNWMNIQKLLRGRHTQAGGSGNLRRIYPLGITNKLRREPAYQSTQEPVTGTYSMKHYMGGSTEVFSMTMEYFSIPKKALNLIENDPLQAAIILDAIQPVQFADHLPSNLYHLFPNRFTELQDM